MKPIRDLMNKRLSLLAVLGLALMWGVGAPIESRAQDSHAGHDHTASSGDGASGRAGRAAHADKDEHDESEAGDVHDEKEAGGHEGHDEHGDEEDLIKLSAADLKEFNIEVTTASAGRLDQYVELPGEIVLNADRLAHVPPTLPGVVRKVFKHLGDHVETGEVLAVISSRELADAKAEYLAARERLTLAQANAERETSLRQKEISSESEYLDAKNALAEALITHNSTEQKLHALGFSESDIREMPQHPSTSFTDYDIKAPFSGTIIEKHITLGENLDIDTSAFTIADLSDVWVDISVYQKDLSQIHKQQKVLIKVGHGVPDVTAEIQWVSPIVDEVTRTANARVVLINANGDLRPGMFITAEVAASSRPVNVMIPKTALQTVDERTVVFVQTDEGFEPQPIEIGEKNSTHVEVVSGVNAGQAYVSKGAFTLKAQLSKGAFGDGHNH